MSRRLPDAATFPRAILRTVLSPAGFAFGFVVLLIATCPGSRGDGAVELLLLQEGGVSGVAASGSADPLTVASMAPANRFADDVTHSFGRSKTPSERAREQRATNPVSFDSFRRMRHTLPMLAVPMPGMETQALNLQPMTGPSVGSNDIVVADSVR